MQFREGSGRLYHILAQNDHSYCCVCLKSRETFMPFASRLTAGFITALCFSSFAFASPPLVEDNTEELIDKIEETLSDHKVEIAKSTARLKRKMDSAKDSAGETLEGDLEVMADVLEDVFAEDGVFRDLTAMFSDFAKEMDVDTDDGKTTLSFGGTEVAQIQHKSSRDSEDSISISGLGRSFSMDRKTVVENGKSKTRIVIDMNGEDEIDLTLPTPNP